MKIEYQHIGGQLVPVIIAEHRPLGRFPKGVRPWNKGKRGLSQLGGETKFAIGHEPHNSKHDGCVSIRVTKGIPYKYIRLAKAKWVPLHRYLWEQRYGAIPKGYVVAFVDGNTLNCDIRNLYMLSQAENLERNRNRNKQADTMKRLWASDRMRKDYGLEQKTKLRIK